MLRLRGNFGGFPPITCQGTPIHGKNWFEMKHGYLLDRHKFGFSVVERVLATKIVHKSGVF